eukprot:7782663-Alexandrium_andersonii.AAC.1
MAQNAPSAAQSSSFQTWVLEHMLSSAMLGHRGCFASSPSDSARDTAQNAPSAASGTNFEVASGAA